jgi:hypothetical protein
MIDDRERAVIALHAYRLIGLEQQKIESRARDSIRKLREHRGIELNIKLLVGQEINAAQQKVELEYRAARTVNSQTGRLVLNDWSR